LKIDSYTTKDFKIYSPAPLKGVRERRWPMTDGIFHSQVVESETVSVSLLNRWHAWLLQHELSVAIALREEIDLSPLTY
jgi:hypothetical protein